MRVMQRETSDPLDPSLLHLDFATFARRVLAARGNPASAGPASDEQLLFFGVWESEGTPNLMASIGNTATGQSSLYTTPLDVRSWRSLAGEWPALLWPELEVADRLGVLPAGHPDPHPLLHPERHTLQSRVTGAGAFPLPLGPVRADVTESGFFLFDTIGEQIMHMQPQLYYKHRDVERLAVGRSMDDVTLLAERISGVTTAAHTAAYASAVEQACGWMAPEPLRYERQLFMELERLYNHAHDIGQLASAAGMTVAHAQLTRVKEDCLRMAARLTGSRYLRTAVSPFRFAPVDWPDVRTWLLEALARVDARLQQFVSLLRRTPTFVDRLVGTGTVERTWVPAYGLVGPTARACGFRTDARLAYAPWTAHAGFSVAVAPRAQGDALDRFLVRVEEWRVSVDMIRWLVSQLASTRPTDRWTPPEVNADEARGWGVGTVEGPRGRISHVVCVERGRIGFWGVRSASSWIWPVFGLATANGNIQTDFPVMDASFGLSYAGTDR